MDKNPFVIGKPSINGPFSMAMSNNQMVILFFKFHALPLGKSKSPILGRKDDDKKLQGLTVEWTE